jgi:hypothetical protein
MNSNQIIELLKDKHSKDVFVSECKDGPSSVGGVRMDAWAMKKSWAHSLSVGYEIKVGRGDFLHDTKWHSYLPCCNEFYFVCPGPEVIKVEEVGPEAGLLYVASTGSRLITKKRAPYRPLTVPEDFYRYILMCRVKIERPHLYFPDNDEEIKVAFWKDWLADRTEQRIIGHRVSKRLAQLYEEQVEKVKLKQDQLQNRLDQLEKVEQIVTSYGIRISTWDLDKEVKRKILNIPEDLQFNLKLLEQSIAKFKQELHKLDKEKEDEPEGPDSV